jgi:pyruvate,water dikinase
MAVRAIDELSRDDTQYAGGKGANLGELTKGGFPVPPGFVVGAPAYAAFCEAGGLPSRLDELLRAVDVDNTEALDAAATEARAMVEREPVPPWIESAIRSAWTQLAGGEEIAGERRGHGIGLVRRYERDVSERPRRG